MADETDQRSLYAFIAEGADGGIAACALQTPQGVVWGTLVTLDNPKILSVMREQAKQIAKDSGRSLRLVKYKAVETVEVITPETRDALH